MQNDFCSPEGALYVKGAMEDVERLGSFITRYSDLIDHIVLTADNHQVIDISHPGFWEDLNGRQPAPYTMISESDISDGKWLPRFSKEKATEYIRNLEIQGEFPHIIWPEHCIIGSIGAAIVDEIMKPVSEWARKGRFFDLIVKGTNPFTEHFGALMANVPISDSPETQLNEELVKKLRLFDTILVAGEARSHCVANTVKQMLNIGGFETKLIILDDCTSDVTGFETLAAPIYEKAHKKGVRWVRSTELF
jgi:nicotinamidase-related amidase